MNLLKRIFLITVASLLTTQLLFLGTGFAIDYENLQKGDAVYVIVNGLRIRSEPYLQAEKINNLRQGAKVFLTGNKGEESFTVTLRDQEFTAPFVEVIWEGQKTGWVYGGALSNE